MRGTVRRLVEVVGALLLITACARVPQTPASQATAVPVATVAPSPTVMAFATFTPIASSTVTATVTPTVLPTSTPTPPAPTAEPTRMPTAEPQRYSTRELKLASGSPQGMTLWKGKVIYSDVGVASQPGEKTTSRIVEHDLATGRETVLIEARPPHTGAHVLHRSGDWLIYYEGGTTEPGLAAFNPPVDYYAVNLRTGQSQHLVVIPGGCRSAPSLSGSAFSDDGGFAYIAIDRSSGECRDQLRLYDLETGEDRLLLETESADTFLDNPLLSGNKVIYSQAWQGEWPPDTTPTPIPGRPGPWPPRYRITGDIFSLDLETGERVNLSNTGSASQPALWGDYLMWIDEPVGAAQEHGSGEVYIRNTMTGQRKRLTDDATYMRLYSSPLAGEGFFVWGDAHQVKDRLPVYLPETSEMVYLEGPGGGPTVSNGRPDGNTLFWAWSGWSGVSTRGLGRAVVDWDQVKDRPWRVYMTTFE
jgi:hypothetical protein